VTISKVRLAALGSLCALVFTGVGIGAGVALADQPHMQNALGDLDAAQSELQIALPDKGGHRVNAINLIGQAISEVNLGIQAGAR
jgi:hypothetical protein